MQNTEARVAGAAKPVLIAPAGVPLSVIDTSGLAGCESKAMAKFSAAFGNAGTCFGDAGDSSRT
jgi:hypothetical protein